MADDLEECEFWLPSEFLNDDDVFVGFKGDSKGEGKRLLNGLNPLGPYSGLSSPESDEEEYITGLAHKMVQTTLQDSGFGYENHKGWSLSSSPQSTLCGGCMSMQGSSNGSPNRPSQATSPTGVHRREGALDLLYAAAGEVARMKMEEGAGLCHHKTGIWAPVSVGPTISEPSLQSFCSYQQLQMAQRLKQLQIMKQSQQLAQGRTRNEAGRPLNLSKSTWPNLQQSLQQQQPQPGSGMRAVFLGNTGPKRECAGTGVFIPRRVNGPQTETRKKQGCSTVLLPDRVVQALNLKLNPIEAPPQLELQQPRFNNDGGLKCRNNMTAAQQKRNVRIQPAAMSHEPFLPREWSY